MPADRNIPVSLYIKCIEYIKHSLHSGFNNLSAQAYTHTYMILYCLSGSRETSSKEEASVSLSMVLKFYFNICR